MAVLIRHRADGLTEELYDQVAPPLIESAKQAPGFILHVTYEDGNGFCVSEIWETQEQHDAWFNENGRTEPADGDQPGNDRPAQHPPALIEIVAAAAAQSAVAAADPPLNTGL